MDSMKRHLCALLIVSVLVVPVLMAAGQESAGTAPRDRRLDPPKTYNDYFPWTPPTSKEAWQKRRQQVREQVLVATGLWPAPPKTPLQPIIHGKIDRDDYTIEKVFFASYPGHYVCGNLYRPKGRTGKLPGVLSPHGHWANGRFFQASDQEVQNQLGQGAEKTPDGARYPLQTRCAQLARMGCVVFHYDMVGYADSQQIGHRQGFLDPEAELRLQSFMGLQTWNSVRALDFLVSLPDVDPARIGVTGASGGGTQTFILCAIDHRPAVAFPAVMVSTAMQGGCICENCSHLRVGTGNIELAGLFAPKPLGMSGANDWTKAIETKGLPELQALYRLLGAPDNVMAKAYVQFGHNYNQVSRELMYNWFNKHLKLGQSEPVVERPFVPVAPKELSVFDEQHSLPKDAVNAEGLRRYLTESSDKQIADLVPFHIKGLAKFRGLSDFRRVIGTALRVMVNDTLPAPDQVKGTAGGFKTTQMTLERIKLTRKGKEEVVPASLVRSPPYDGTVVVWVHPAGTSSLWQDGKNDVGGPRGVDQLAPAARAILDRKAAVLAVEVFETGKNGATHQSVDKKFAGYTFGYNRPLLANRVHDILTAVAYARGLQGAKKVYLVGFDKAGPWVLLARGLCGDAVVRTAADMNQFRFEHVRTMDDEMMLPGAVKYGGLPALAALAAPGDLYLHNHRGTASGRWLKGVYEAAGAADRLHRQAEKASAETVVAWLLR
jgi:dienelactone hydrolase